MSCDTHRLLLGLLSQSKIHRRDQFLFIRSAIVQDSSFVQMETDALANDAFIRNHILKILYKDINHILKIGDET